MLQNTVLGLVVSGPLNNTTQISQCYSVNEYIDESLTKFWEVEEYSQSSIMSEDDVNCETIFEKTASRDVNGRFVLRIPLRYFRTLLGNFKELAIKRFLQLERRFQQNNILKEQYTSFINEYKNLEHATFFTGDTSDLFFLPRHGVLRHDSLTTKLRVVFDGSAVSSSGWSVNDLQYVGPTIQNYLFTILLQFRCHNIAVCADIEKIYRQILIHPDDRHLQTILWRENPGDPILPFSLNTVSYGMKSSLYLAISRLKQSSYENESQFPFASKVLRNNFYVDDLIVFLTKTKQLMFVRC